MAKAPSLRERQMELVQSIIDLGTRAYHPSVTGDAQIAAQKAFDEHLEKINSLNLVPALNLLMRPGAVEPWLRKKLVRILTLIPLRPDGVRATLEFVFAVHPSGPMRMTGSAEPQKKGANITQESMLLACQMLTAPPSGVTPEAWFAGIAPQLFDLLDGNEGEELVKVAAYIMGFGILGRKESGVPGTSGWKYFADSMLNPIMPPATWSQEDTADQQDEIVDLSEPRVLVSSSDLEKALRRLQALVLSHPNPGLCKRLLGQISLPLWALAFWPKSAGTALSERYCHPAAELLKIFIRLSDPHLLLLHLIRHIGYVGGRDSLNPEWLYLESADGGIQVSSNQGPRAAEKPAKRRLSLESFDQRISALLTFAEPIYTDREIAIVFLTLFKDWTASTSNRKPWQLVSLGQEDEEDPMHRLTKLKVLQEMMERFSDKLASQPAAILEVVEQILGNYFNNTNDEEGVSVALSLVNLIITAPGFQKKKVPPKLLESVQECLERISKLGIDDVSTTARNLSLFLQYVDEDPDDTNAASAATERQAEDRKTYALAMQYITQPDSPAPVKSEGLNLLSGLITSQSPILDIPGTLVLLSSLLRDDDEYINLNVIKLFTKLANKHPKSVVKELLDHYIDAKERFTVDTRLRFGEALLQAVERLGETFTGEVSHQVGEALLATAGRRGHRPKTQARQAREQRLQQMKNKEAAEAWGGEVPDFSDDGAAIPADERARNDAIAAIVAGWESQRGAEDVRVRASSLSIFAQAMESNIAGLGATLVAAAVDLAVAVLQVEAEPGQGILRRAAVLLVMSFVRALDAAKQRRQQLGFGLAARDDVVRILTYVAETDNDGLVRQHAKDVVESLENWEMAAMVPESAMQAATTGETVLTKLAGLKVGDLGSQTQVQVQGLGQGQAQAQRQRPKIEEVE